MRLDASSPGSQFGQIKIATNDPNAPTYGFNVKGVVSGSPPSGAPVIGITGPAVVYNKLGPAVVLYGQSSLSDADSTNYTGGSLSVAFASGGLASDQLGIINQGWPRPDRSEWIERDLWRRHNRIVQWWFDFAAIGRESQCGRIDCRRLCARRQSILHQSLGESRLVGPLSPPQAHRRPGK